MKAYEVVRRHIEQRILDAELTVGSLLPPERELATQLGVSRTAVREALRTLEAQGLISAAVGAGPGSGTRIASQHTSALGKLLQMHVALAEFPVDDVVDVRVTLERSSVELLAKKVTHEDLATLGDLLAEMEAVNLDLDRFNALDTLFHVTIAALSGNQLIAVLTQAVRQSLARPIQSASRSLSDYPEFRRGLIRQHRRVFEAIALRDASGAADLMEDHIRSAYAILPISSLHPPSAPLATQGMV